MELEDLRPWHGLLRTGMWAAWAGVAMVVIQMTIYVFWPPPETAEGYFDLLVKHPLLGMLSLDLLYVVSNLLAFLVYLALTVVLWRVSRSGVTIAMGLSAIGIAAYMSAPRAVEMLTLAHSYADAGPAERVALLATGDGMLAGWMGTAFDIYYVLNGIALVVFVVLMFRSSIFSRATAWWGVVAAILMTVPTNFGVVGLIFAISSLVPWVVLSVLVAGRFRALSALEPVEPLGSSA
jgi:hypothetical protein